MVMALGQELKGCWLKLLCGSLMLYVGLVSHPGCSNTLIRLAQWKLGMRLHGTEKGFNLNLIYDTYLSKHGTHVWSSVSGTFNKKNLNELPIL